jgi:hypothetical protein
MRKPIPKFKVGERFTERYVMSPQRNGTLTVTEVSVEDDEDGEYEIVYSVINSRTGKVEFADEDFLSNCNR